MKSRFIFKSMVVLLVALVSNLPLYATCTRQQCLIGGLTCDQLLYDVGFDQNCWTLTGTAQIVSSPYYHAKFSGSSNASAYQDVAVPTGWTNHELTIHIDNNTSGYSSGRLYVEIRNTSNGLLETLNAFAATDTDGRYDLHFSDYGGQTIRIAFRYVPGYSPGNGEFLVDSCSYFVY
jgi:hypothetical protein